MPCATARWAARRWMSITANRCGEIILVIEFDNVIITPHIAGATREYRQTRR